MFVSRGNKSVVSSGVAYRRESSGVSKSRRNLCLIASVIRTKVDKQGEHGQVGRHICGIDLAIPRMLEVIHVTSSTGRKMS